MEIAQIQLFGLISTTQSSPLIIYVDNDRSNDEKGKKLGVKLFQVSNKKLPLKSFDDDKFNFNENGMKLNS